jgi:hypothetical protein
MEEYKAWFRDSFGRLPRRNVLATANWPWSELLMLVCLSCCNNAVSGISLSASKKLSEFGNKAGFGDGVRIACDGAQATAAPALATGPSKTTTLSHFHRSANKEAHEKSNVHTVHNTS